MRTIRMTIEYVGTAYHGWQTQPQGNTVQDVVELRLGRILNHAVRVHGSGRTDRGVHARGQVASFRTENSMDLERILRGLNALLPPDVAVTECVAADDSFHARHSATAREYCYQVWRGRICSPFLYPFVHHVYGPLDLEAMRGAAQRIVGRHDFTSFCAAESSGGNMERDVLASDWEQDGDLWRYRIMARSFLHHMVRNLVGTLLEVGKGQRSPDQIESILAARDRRRAGAMAPAKGLFLERVRYDGRAREEAGA